MSVINVHVQNLRKLGYSSLDEWLKNPNHIYIGRENRYVQGAKNSIWANPYSVTKYGRNECLKLYKEYILNSELLNKLPELKGKTLGCWCHPEPCHGHILLEIIQAQK